VFRRRKSAPAPPTQDDVVDRVLCIAVTTMLAAVVANRREGALDEAQAEQYAAESHRWLRRENLADALTVGERALVAKSLEDWSERESVDTDWRNESVGVLLWAISAIPELPVYDGRFGELAPLVPLLAPTDEFRRVASLRPAEELEAARAEAYRPRDEAEPADVRAIARERRRALNWLCGASATWDSAPTGS
jgi:Domain of unknown function (DUF4272)